MQQDTGPLPINGDPATDGLVRSTVASLREITVADAMTKKEAAKERKQKQGQTSEALSSSSSSSSSDSSNEKRQQQETPKKKTKKKTRQNPEQVPPKMNGAASVISTASKRGVELPIKKPTQKKRKPIGSEDEEDDDEEDDEDETGSEEEDGGGLEPTIAELVRDEKKGALSSSSSPSPPADEKSKKKKQDATAPRSTPRPMRATVQAMKPAKKKAPTMHLPKDLAPSTVKEDDDGEDNTEDDECEVPELPDGYACLFSRGKQLVPAACMRDDEKTRTEFLQNEMRFSDCWTLVDNSPAGLEVDPSGMKVDFLLTDEGHWIKIPSIAFSNNMKKAEAIRKNLEKVRHDWKLAVANGNIKSPGKSNRSVEPWNLYYRYLRKKKSPSAKKPSSKKQKMSLETGVGDGADAEQETKKTKPKTKSKTKESKTADLSRKYEESVAEARRSNGADVPVAGSRQNRVAIVEAAKKRNPMLASVFAAADAFRGSADRCIQDAIKEGVDPGLFIGSGRTVDQVIAAGSDAYAQHEQFVSKDRAMWAFIVFSLRCEDSSGMARAFHRRWKAQDDNKTQSQQAAFNTMWEKDDADNVKRHNEEKKKKEAHRAKAKAKAKEEADALAKKNPKTLFRVVGDSSAKQQKEKEKEKEKEKAEEKGKEKETKRDPKTDHPAAVLSSFSSSSLSVGPPPTTTKGVASLAASSVSSVHSVTSTAPSPQPVQSQSTARATPTSSSSSSSSTSSVIVPVAQNHAKPDYTATHTVDTVSQVQTHSMNKTTADAPTGTVSKSQENREKSNDGKKPDSAAVVQPEAKKTETAPGAVTSTPEKKKSQLEEKRAALLASAASDAAALGGEEPSDKEDEENEEDEEKGEKKQEPKKTASSSSASSSITAAASSSSSTKQKQASVDEAKDADDEDVEF